MLAERSSDYITIQSAAQESGYVPEVLRRGIRDGRIPGRKIDRCWYISADIVAQLKERRNS